jgi:HSP20 family molecular chaperone IbpA
MLPSIFDDVFGDVFENNNEAMKTDVRLVGDNYLLDVALPGYDKEDIKLELERGYLTITAEHKEKETKKDEKYIRRESFYGKCSRTFYVGDNLSDEDIKANYKNGILSVTVPKTSKVDNKKVIEIKD